MTFAPPSSLTVSGTVTATQGTIPWEIDGTVSVSSVPLAAGAATESTLDRIKRAVNDLAFPADTEQILPA